MRKTLLAALPVLALVAAAGLAAAYPILNTEDMTQDEKTLRIQMLEIKQEMLQDEISYLNGEITQEQYQERLQTHRDEMQPLFEQLREMHGDEDMPCGGGFGHGPGRFMMGGF